MTELNQELLRFVEQSPSPYHCVASAARRLEQRGFERVDEGAEPEILRPGDMRYIARGGTLVAWVAGRASPNERGFVLLGAHTDSPNLRIKPRPDVAAEGYAQWGVEVYGGALLSTWLDRDLGVAGRAFVRGEDGRPEPRLFRVDRPVARVPNLAIHFNRKVNTEGLKLDKQRHLPPLIGLGEQPDFGAWVGTQLAAEVLSWDACLYDITAPCLGGIDEEFIYSARLDNQASCFQCLRALVDVGGGEATHVMALFDHEEVGSRSASGAMGTLLRDVLSRIERDHAMRREGGLERAAANSWLLSLDMAHAVHPNYADMHEKNHRPILGGGPVIKHHVEQRYATDGETTARFRLACEEAEVPYQDFVVRSDLACGSTIGPISSAQLGMKTIDIGNPMLSMHSIREQAGAADTEHMLRVLRHILSRS